MTTEQEEQLDFSYSYIKYEEWKDILERNNLSEISTFCTCNPFWDFTDFKCQYCKSIWEYCPPADVGNGVFGGWPTDNQWIDMHSQRVLNFFIYLGSKGIDLQKNREKILSNMRNIIF